MIRSRCRQWGSGSMYVGRFRKCGANYRRLVCNANESVVRAEEAWGQGLPQSLRPFTMTPGANRSGNV